MRIVALIALNGIMAINHSLRDKGWYRAAWAAKKVGFAIAEYFITSFVEA